MSAINLPLCLHHFSFYYRFEPGAEWRRASAAVGQSIIAGHQLFRISGARSIKRNKRLLLVQFHVMVFAREAATLPHPDTGNHVQVATWVEDEGIAFALAAVGEDEVRRRFEELTAI